MIKINNKNESILSHSSCCYFFTFYLIIITPIKTLAEYRDLRLAKLVVNGGAPEGQQQQQATGGADEMKQRQESHKRMLEKNPALAEA